METPLVPSRKDLEQAYRAHDPLLAGHQQAEAVVISAGDVLVLCSQNPKGEGEHTWLIRLAPDGSVVWEKHFGLDLGVGRAITELAGGGFAIAGDVRRAEMEYQAIMFRLAPDGEVIARGTFGPRGVTGLVAAATLADGFIVAGGTAGWEGWLLSANSELRGTWESPLEGTDDVYGVAPREYGGFAVAAAREKSTTELGKTSVLAFATDRSVVWRTDLPAEGRGEPAALASLPGGELAMIGHHSSGDAKAAGLWIVRLSSTGALVWEKVLRAPDEERRGRAITALTDGGVAVAGDAARVGRRGLRVARLAADGTVVWERSFGGEHSDVARGLARTDDGGLVLVGSTASRGPGKTNVWILRLDGDGRLLWDRVLGVAG